MRPKQSPDRNRAGRRRRLVSNSPPPPTFPARGPAPRFSPTCMCGLAAHRATGRCTRVCPGQMMTRICLRCLGRISGHFRRAPGRLGPAPHPSRGVAGSDRSRGCSRTQPRAGKSGRGRAFVHPTPNAKGGRVGPGARARPDPRPPSHALARGPARISESAPPAPAGPEPYCGCVWGGWAPSECDERAGGELAVWGKGSGWAIPAPHKLAAGSERVRRTGGAGRPGRPFGSGSPARAA